MRVGKRLFPYPILNNDLSFNNFKTSLYSLSYEEEIENDNFILKNAHIILENEKVINLIKDKKVSATIIVESSSTIFRESYDVSMDTKDILIPLHNLDGKVEISSFIYANEDLIDYHSRDFLEDYENYKFSIEKYSILAVDDGYTTKIDYDTDSDKKPSSIFSIIKTENSEKTMKTKMDDKNIIIYLPEEEFGFYDNIKGLKNVQNIFFSMLAIPALSSSLQKLKTNLNYNHFENIDEIKQEHSWFNTIISAYEKKFEVKLDRNKFLDLDMLELSQQLLNDGTVNGLQDFFGIVTRKDFEEDYE